MPAPLPLSASLSLVHAVFQLLFLFFSFKMSASARVFWHRWGSLSVPGLSPGNGSAAASSASMVSSNDLAWTHIIIDTIDGSVPGLDAGPLCEDGGSLASAEAALRTESSGGGSDPGAGYKGLAAVLAAAASGLETSLSSAGRVLTRIPVASARGRSSHAALLAAAIAVGATELHTVVSRDPFVSSDDSELRAFALSKGVAVVLHDACYLVHPHRLALSSAASEGSVGAASHLSDDEGGPSAASQPLATNHNNAPATTTAASLADCRSSDFLPPHLLSFDVFSRGLRVNAGDAYGRGISSSAGSSANFATLTGFAFDSPNEDDPSCAVFSPSELAAAKGDVDAALNAFPAAALILARSACLATGNELPGMGGGATSTTTTTTTTTTTSTATCPAEIDVSPLVRSAAIRALAALSRWGGGRPDKSSLNAASNAALPTSLVASAGGAAASLHASSSAAVSISSTGSKRLEPLGVGGGGAGWCALVSPVPVSDLRVTRARALL